MKYEFIGQGLYGNFHENYKFSSVKNYEEVLKKDFDIDIELDNYIYRDSLSLYKDLNKDGYIIYEIFEMRKGDEVQNKIFLKRCYMVKNYFELEEKLPVYANNLDKNTIS